MLNTILIYVLVRVNGTLICSDTSVAYSCSYLIPKGNNKVYAIEAKAFDAAGNSSSSQISVTSGSGGRK